MDSPCWFVSDPTGTVILNTGTYLIGAGSGAISPNFHSTGVRNVYGTQFYETVDNVPMIQIGNGQSIPGDAVILENMRLSYNANQSSDPSSGSTVISTTSNASTQVHLKNVFVDGWYNGINRQYGRYWDIDHCTFYNNIHAGIWLQELDEVDEGDDNITNNLILGGSPYQLDGVTAKGLPYAGFLWNSAGGLRYVSNKHNTGLINTSGNYTTQLYNLVIQPLGGVNTGEFTITNCSFGAFVNSGILFDFTTAASAATINKANINSNVFLRNVVHDGLSRWPFSWKSVCHHSAGQKKRGPRKRLLKRNEHLRKFDERGHRAALGGECGRGKRGRKHRPRTICRAGCPSRIVRDP